MKRFLLSFILCCNVICGFAQGNLSFNGIPIKGSLDSFSQQLKGKGYNEIKSNEQAGVFQGEFYGNNATIIAFAVGGNVVSVIVMFDQSGEWNTLENTYKRYKGLLSKQYGNPIECIEKMPDEKTTNTALMTELYRGNVRYGSLFESSGGKVGIFIEKGTTRQSGVVAIQYGDLEAAIKKYKDSMK